MAHELGLSLSAQESKVLQHLQGLPEGKRVPDSEIGQATGLGPEVIRGSLERLRAKRYVAVEERHHSSLVITERGTATAKGGLPERRLLTVLSASPLSQLEARERCGFDDKEFSVAVGQLKRSGHLKMGERMELQGPVPEHPFPEEALLLTLSQRAGAETFDKDLAERLVRRGLATVEHHSDRLWSASAEGRRLTFATEGQGTVGALTSALMHSGEWEKMSFRTYDVRAQVPYVTGARTHTYLAWLREFEEILLGLGFEERRGPLVETEFYNSDALFIPQNHPARSMQDVFFLDGVEGKLPPEDLLHRVASVHEGKPFEGGRRLSAGWGTRYKTEIAKRPLLRAHTTPVSVRYLLTHPSPPFRMYSIAPAFRRDSVDAKHHIQFEQCEGVFGAEQVSIRDLKGLFVRVAKALGIHEVRFKPSYFPFTEPSIEGYVKHPSLGWIEVLPGGLFRPEVLRPLGVQVPVAAWGIGIGRLATVALGLQDIRELFSNDLGTLAEARV